MQHIEPQWLTLFGHGFPSSAKGGEIIMVFWSTSAKLSIYNKLKIIICYMSEKPQWVEFWVFEN